MELPDNIVRASHRNPRTMLIYTKPKEGKTTLLSGLENALLVDTEKGSDFVDARKVQVENFAQLSEVARKIYEKGNKDGTYTPPYQYTVIDTLTRIDEWSEIQGTFKY